MKHRTLCDYMATKYDTPDKVTAFGMAMEEYFMDVPIPNEPLLAAKTLQARAKCCIQHLALSDSPYWQAVPPKGVDSAVIFPWNLRYDAGAGVKGPPPPPPGCSEARVGGRW